MAPFKYAAIATAGWTAICLIFLWIIVRAELAAGATVMSLLEKPSTFLTATAIIVPVAVLWALALEGLSPAGQEELLSLVGRPFQADRDGPEGRSYGRVQRVRELYQQAGVFEKAHRLIEKHQERAEAIADEIQPEELRRLLYYLIDSVLDGPKPAPAPQIVPLQIASA